jgi:hypothetical protein
MVMPKRTSRRTTKLEYYIECYIDFSRFIIEDQLIPQRKKKTTPYEGKGKAYRIPIGTRVGTAARDGQ